MRVPWRVAEAALIREMLGTPVLPVLTLGSLPHPVAGGRTPLPETLLESDNAHASLARGLVFMGQVFGSGPHSPSPCHTGTLL